MKKHGINANPKHPTLRLNKSQRAIGRLIEIELDQEPTSEAQVDLGGDLFWNLYSQDAKPLPKDELPFSRQINDTLINMLKESKGWGKMLQSTQANMPVSLVSSALSWAGLTTEEALQDALDKQREAEEREKEAAAAQAQAQGLQAAANAAKAEGEEGEEEAEALEAAAAAAQAKAEASAKAAQEAAAAAMESLEEAADDPRTKAAISNHTAEAADEAEDLAEGMAAYGLDAGTPEYNDPAAALRFVDKFGDKLAQIAKMAGRYRGIAMQQSREKVAVGHIIGGVENTRDLLDVLPTERAFLRKDAPPIIRTQKISQYVEAGLPGYRRYGEAKEEGPVVIVVDGSGSMGGTPELIAKSVAIGVGQAVRAGGRPFMLVSFAGPYDPVHVYDSRESWDQLMEWAAKFQNGGTDYNTAFQAMIEALDDLGDRAEGVDAIFVSDGAGNLSQQWRERWQTYREERGSRFLLVPVGYFHGGVLGDIPDQVLPLSDLSEDTGDALAQGLSEWIR